MSNPTATPTADAVPGGPAARRVPVPGRATGRGRELRAFAGLAHLALVGWMIITAAPLFWVLLASFKSNREIFLGRPFALPGQVSTTSYAAAWE